MIRLWIVRFRRRSAVSTMIGGIIVLTLFLTALGAMVLVSQQYDTYQQTVNFMSQKDIDRFSENLQVPYPRPFRAHYCFRVRWQLQSV